MLSFVIIQDLTATDYNPEYPRTVSLTINDETGDIHLLGVLPHQSKLGIDEPNAKLLVDALIDKFPEMYQSEDNAPAFHKHQAD